MKSRLRSMASAVTIVLILVAVSGTAHGQAIADGDYWWGWMGGYDAAGPNVEPVTQRASANVAGNTWTLDGQSSAHGGESFLDTMTVTSVTTLPDGYVEVVDSDGEATLVAGMPSLGVNVFRQVSNGDLGMAVILPKATGPLSMFDFEGNVKTVAFQTDPTPNVGEGELMARAQFMDFDIVAASATESQPFFDGHHLVLDPAAATLTPEGPEATSFMGIGQGGMTLYMGVGQDGTGDVDELWMGIGMLQPEALTLADATGRYAIQGQHTNIDLSWWNTVWGILEIRDDGTFQIDFEGDGQGDEPAGWTADGTASLTADGWFEFDAGGDGGVVTGMINRDLNTLVLGDPGDDEVGMYIATRVVPEPATMALVGLGLAALTARRRR